MSLRVRDLIRFSVMGTWSLGWNHGIALYPLAVPYQGGSYASLQWFVKVSLVGLYCLVIRHGSVGEAEGNSTVSLRSALSRWITLPLADYSYSSFAFFAWMSTL